MRRAISEIASRRREGVQQNLRQASLMPAPDVSHLSLTELNEIFSAHVANDDASSTIAARHEDGQMDEAELRSLVADILRLRDGK